MRKRWGIYMIWIGLAAGGAYSSELPYGVVKLRDIVPGIQEDIRYASVNNFTGHEIAGYRKSECWLRDEAAIALAKVYRTALDRGLSLVVYDCYRPRKAVLAFIEWARSDDERTKKTYYPNVLKEQLFKEGYIALESNHTKGQTVDIGLVGLDFGTPFDYFDPTSNTLSQAVSLVAQRNRALLLELMAAGGFKNLPTEWWHYTLETTTVYGDLVGDIE